MSASEMTPRADAARVDVGRLGRKAAKHLLARAVAMRLVTLAGTIVLARLLRPEDFGVYAVVTVVVTLITGLGDLGIGSALIQQDHYPTRKELATTWTAQQIIWVTIVVAVELAAPAIAGAIPALGDDGTAMLRVVSLALLFSGLRSLPSIMMSRELRFGPLAAIEVIQQIVYFAVAILLAASGAGVWSFIVAAVVQTAVGAALTSLAWGHWAGVGLDLAIVRRLLGFGIGFQTGYFLSWLRDAVVPIFGGLAGGVGAIGLLTFAWRNGQIVSSLDEIIGRVTFPAVSRMGDDRNRLSSVATAIVSMSALVGVIQTWIIAVAPVLVPTVFGPQWEPAIPALQLVCLGTLATIPTRFLSSTIYAMGWARTGLLLSAFGAGILVVAFILLVFALGLTGGGLAFAISAGIVLALHAQATAHRLPLTWVRVARIYVECALAAVASIIVITLLPTGLGLALAGLTHLCVFGLLALAFERDEIDRARRFLQPALEAG